jgi:hypothetical protein
MRPVSPAPFDRMGPNSDPINASAPLSLLPNAKGAFNGRWRYGRRNLDVNFQISWAASTIDVGERFR